MKNKTLATLIGVLSLSCGSSLQAQELFRADFETYATTPYFFRFGNKGKLGEYTYKPRWMYSHTVIDNPVASEANESSKVLQYTSMEAQNYGLKFLFAAPVDVRSLKEIQFKIFQPESAVGKATWDGTAAATKQDICLKLLSKFNTINDFKQDDGILLYKSATAFTETGRWITYSFRFDAADYASQLDKFTDGVLGVALLPTYNSGVTLREDTPYVCYIDDLVVNPITTGIHSTVSGSGSAVRYADGKILIDTSSDAPLSVSVYTMEGKLVSVTKNLLPEYGTAELPFLADNNRIYLVQVSSGEESFSTKICGL